MPGQRTSAPVLNSFMYGCASACSTVNRFAGLKASNFSMMSMASGGADMSEAIFFFSCLGKLWSIGAANLEFEASTSSVDGLPVTCTVNCTWNV